MVQVLDEAALPSSEVSGDIVVSTEYSDDAAVVRLEGDGERAVVLTADVIAPIVDDPETFGAIAATNSISDVYAMGGRPLYALNLVFFADDELPLEVLHAIMRGGARACREAGVPIVGGHTVRDPEIKYGLSVTGEVKLDQLLSNRTAEPGQALVLTKALGTGILGSVIKKQLASPQQYDAAVASMTQHNGPALEISRRYGVTSCTDVTGFGLLGHLRNILVGSRLAARLEMSTLPALPGAIEHARDGRVPAGSKANLAFVEPTLTRSGTEDPLLSLLAADAQTSGGLLLTVPAEGAQELVAELRVSGHASAAVIGSLSSGAAGSIELAF